MNNEPAKLSRYSDYAQRGIKEINGDLEAREKIMFYEIRMSEHEQVAGKARYEQGKADSAKITLENQLNNGKTLEQVTESVRNLKLIPDKELEKIIDLYR